MTYFDLLAWDIENKSRLEGCRIDNIYTTKESDNTFLFHLHCKDGDKDLIIQPGKRIHFTKFTVDRETNGQVSFLRTLLREAFIKSTKLLGHERIYLIETSNGKQVIVELLPRGVLVVTDENNKIIFSTEVKQFKDRKIKQGEIYSPPPQFVPKKQSLPSALGVPSEIIEALGVTDIEEGKKAVEQLEDNIKKGHIYPCVKEDTVIPIKVEDCAQADSFNDALDTYFTKIEKEEVVSKSTQKLNEEKGRLISTLNEINEKINEYNKQAEKLRETGRKILENYVKIEDIINNNKEKNSVVTNIDGIEITLNPRLNPNKNASIYFDKAKEFEAKAKKAEEITVELKERLNNLEASIKQKEESSKIKIREKEWYEKYRWTITRNGFLVIAGRDVDQNESLVKKMLEDNDIFLHADVHGAPATIIKSNGAEVSEDDIYDASIISACYSKAWKEGLGSIDVFWVKGEQVSKSPPVGEYLPKGSFMIYGKKNFIKNVKLELWLGLEEKSTNEMRLLVGSDKAVKARSKFVVKIVPGEDDQEKASSKIIKILTKEGITGSGGLKNEIIKILPGKSKIIRENA
ncbi:ribosome rescue protein RqcH [Sulfuracidifex tepidarius]|uniref:NFACT RNA-binding domain-containing protein n=1 Tax=Sulfuracidifex tepidarius TaxID=1294262 RepID=A0A510E472_9CREN|nr:ribosome rescue protein RqcH [Sulfuracidifex tepidarius]BBG27322.1 hypothetical protein IC007_1867 [Sulfuracidifex tepidarius]